MSNTANFTWRSALPVLFVIIAGSPATYRHNGRELTLTDGQSGKVVDGVTA